VTIAVKSASCFWLIAGSTKVTISILPILHSISSSSAYENISFLKSHPHSFIGSCWYCDWKKYSHMFLRTSSRYSTENRDSQNDIHSSDIAGTVTISQSSSLLVMYQTRSSSLHLCIIIHIPAFSLCLRDKNVESYHSSTRFRIVSDSASWRVAYGSSIISLCPPLPVIPHVTQ